MMRDDQANAANATRATDSGHRTDAEARPQGDVRTRQDDDRLTETPPPMDH